MRSALRIARIGPMGALLARLVVTMTSRFSSSGRTAAPFSIRAISAVALLGVALSALHCGSSSTSDGVPADGPADPSLDPSLAGAGSAPADDTTPAPVDASGPRGAGPTGDTTDPASTLPDPASATPGPDPCESVKPLATPLATRNAIQACLSGATHHALLTGGTYVIDAGLTVPAGAVLKGTSMASPIVQLALTNTSGVMIELAGGALPPGQRTMVAHLHFDANNAIAKGPVNAVLRVNSDGAIVDGVEVSNPTYPPPDRNGTGVYFVCASCKGNVIKNSSIHHHFYGVLFRNLLTSATPNRVADSDLHDTLCDAVTFIGYGEITGGTIHDVGFDCRNGPIPGAAVYSLNNAHGGLVQNATLTRTCGNAIDIDGGSRFVLQTNDVSEPGFTTGGKYPYCAGFAAAIVDSDHFTVDGNTFAAGHGGLADPNRIFEGAGAGTAADVPFGTGAAVGFVLAQRSNAPPRSQGHSITNNVFRGGGGTGVGLFTSRLTGYGPNGTWSAATTNYFTGNRTFGSNVGSKRCGGNWFAGNSTCAAGSKAPCNDDDYQHGGGFHSDGCSFY